MILVVGLPRSGTTAVARMLHHLGCPMGRTMAMPMPAPGCDLDFEDVNLNAMLRSGEPLASWWPEYEKDRRQQRENFIAAGLPISSEWGAKTVLLYPVLDEIRAIATEPMKVVGCWRPEGDRHESLRKQIKHVANPKIHAEITDAVVAFDAMRREPRGVFVPYGQTRDEALVHDLAALCESKVDAAEVYQFVARHWSAA